MPWWLLLIEGIFAIIVGISMLIAPGMTTSVIVRILGIYWLVGGILSIVSIFINRDQWGLKILIGILGILAGILVIEHPLWSTVLIPTTLVLLIAAAGIIIGFLDIIRAFKGSGWGTGILGVVSILLGILLLNNPLQAVMGSALVIGILLLAGGMIAIVMAFRLR
jgi:uncharacterized membrane protein HdeD (DUF308 family)